MLQRKHVVQRAGQPEILMRVLGAVAQAAGTRRLLRLSEFDQVEGVGDERHPGGGAGAVGGGHVHRQVPQRRGVPGEQAFLRGGGTAFGQLEGAAAVQVHEVGERFGAGAGDLAGLRVGAVGGGAAAD